MKRELNNGYLMATQVTDGQTNKAAKASYSLLSRALTTILQILWAGITARNKQLFYPPPA